MPEPNASKDKRSAAVGSVSLNDFQRLIRDMYLEKDVARGVDGTFMWFMEEIGELASALRDGSHEEQMGEFADVLAPCNFSETAFLSCYGMAECSLAVSFAPLAQGLEIDRLDADTLSRSRRAEPIDDDTGDVRVTEFVNCGRPLPDFEVEIRDDSGSVVDERQCGTVFLRGPSVMSGYANNPQATRESLCGDNWLNTGDVGYRDADGYLFIEGRVDFDAGDAFTRDLVIDGPAGRIRISGRTGLDARDSTSLDHAVPPYSSLIEAPWEPLTIGVPVNFFDAGLDDANAEGAVIGLSGGIDSTTTAAVSAGSAAVRRTRRRSGCSVTSSSAATARARACDWLTPRCSVIVSISCSPTVSSGLREVSGSWKIIPIFLPRSRRRGSPRRAWMGWPVSRISPEAIRAGRSSSPTTALPVIDLPAPDSPTTPRISPAWMS